MSLAAKGFVRQQLPRLVEGCLQAVCLVKCKIRLECSRKCGAGSPCQQVGGLNGSTPFVDELWLNADFPAERLQMPFVLIATLEDIEHVLDSVFSLPFLRKINAHPAADRERVHPRFSQLVTAV